MRLRRLEEELAGRIRLDWRSFLLRPRPGGIPTELAKFRDYTKSWERPAADEDAGTFRVWATEQGPPSHSIPPHLVAKAAATLGDEAFHAVHERLLHAYFAENRDITRPETLLAIWRECGLPDDAFARSADRDLLERVVGEHNEAVERGVHGVPAVRIEGNDVPVVGAQPLAVYRRWFEKVLGESGS